MVMPIPLHVSFAAALLTATSAMAQAPSPGTATDQTFELREGGSVDLGDRGLMLTFPYGTVDRHGAGSIALSVGGFDLGYRPPARIDLKKQLRGDVFPDKPTCAVEFLEVVAPKGAPATARFKMACGGLGPKPLASPSEAKFIPSTSGPAKIVPMKEGISRLAPGQSLVLADGSPTSIKYLGPQHGRRPQDTPGVRLDLGGDQLSANVGERIDLRRNARRNPEIARRDVCFVDVVDVDTSGGSAVLRAFCL